MQRSRAFLPIACLVALILACATAGSRRADPAPPLPALASFERAESDELLDILLEPDFPVPSHLRPCCAFGHDLAVDVSKLSLPMIAISNVVDPKDLGHHRYDGGAVSTRNDLQRAFLSSEKNGIVYSCRGGFIDLAHVRDYADWTVFLARRLRATLPVGLALELPEEGARRFIFVTAVDRDRIERVGGSALAAQLAQWLAFQLSVWHETATWYGWSALPLFSERGSAFSPEDLYSNLLGTVVASYLVQAGLAEDEDSYEAAMDQALADVLSHLGATSVDTTRRVLDRLDGSWWDSRARLPSERIILRRNWSLGPSIAPWRIPEALVDAQLAADLDAQCDDRHAEAAVLPLPSAVGRHAFSDIARVDIRPDAALRSKLPIPASDSGWLSQHDLAGMTRRIAAECETEFGVCPDQPDGPEPAP